MVGALRAAEVELPGDVRTGRTAAADELSQAQRSALHTPRRNGLSTVDTHEELAADLDEHIVRQKAAVSDPEGAAFNDGTR